MNHQSIKNHPFNWRLVGIVGLGNALEVYDFMIYALLAPYISELFFPAQALATNLLLTFAIFAIGYLSRPVGGILFGHKGDTKGRKKPFSFTILLMALSTFLIGCLPTWSTVGVWAPVLLIILRLFQGMSMGGETGGVLTYISEHLPAQRGMAVSAVCVFMCLVLRPVANDRFSGS